MISSAVGYPCESDWADFLYPMFPSYQRRLLQDRCPPGKPTAYNNVQTSNLLPMHFLNHGKNRNNVHPRHDVICQVYKRPNLFGVQNPEKFIQNQSNHLLLGYFGCKTICIMVWTSGSTSILNQLIHHETPFFFLHWKRTVRHLIPQFNNKITIYTLGKPLSIFPFHPFIVPPGTDAVKILELAQHLALQYVSLPNT